MLKFEGCLVIAIIVAVLAGAVLLLGGAYYESALADQAKAEAKARIIEAQAEAEYWRAEAEKSRGEAAHFRAQARFWQARATQVAIRALSELAITMLLWIAAISISGYVIHKVWYPFVYRRREKIATTWERAQAHIPTARG